MTSRLTTLQKICYGAGDTGFSLSTTIVAAFFAIFLTDVVGLSPAAAAAAIFIGRSWDYVNDPVIGHISDRTRTRWGRRRPFLLFGPLPFALAFTMMWWRPPLESQVALAVYYAIAYLLFDTAATFVYMPYFSLTPELTDDYDERTSLTSFRMFFSIAASLAAFTLPLMLIDSFSPQNAGNVLLMGAVFGLASAAPLWLVFATARERSEFMQAKQPRLRESLRAAWKNKPLVFAAGIYLLTWVSMDILQTSLLFFIKYVVEKEGQSDLFMGAIFITAILSLPLWNFLSRRLGKRGAYIAGVSFWALIQMILITLNGGTPIPLILSMCVLAGIGVGAAHVLPWAIMPDTMEYDEWKSGERHEGMFYSLVTLMQKVASSLAIPLVLLVLQFTGYLPNSAVQPASALLGIRIAIGPIPAALLLAAIFLAARFPLDRKTFARILEELQQRRAQNQP